MFALPSLSASVFEGHSGKLAANLSVPDLCWMQTPKVSRAMSDEMSGSEDSEELHGTRLCLGREEQGSSGGDSAQSVGFCCQTSLWLSQCCPSPCPAANWASHILLMACKQSKKNKKASHCSGQKALWLKGCIFYYLCVLQSTNNK